MEYLLFGFLPDHIKSLCNAFKVSQKFWGTRITVAKYTGFDATRGLNTWIFPAEDNHLCFHIFSKVRTQVRKIILFNQSFIIAETNTQILMLLFVSEVHFHFTGLVLRFFALPIQHASHFSTLILSNENSLNFFNNFRIFLRDWASFTKKSYHQHTNCFILKPLIEESALTWINKISRDR